MTIHIINGSEERGSSYGTLNSSLVHSAEGFLKRNYSITTTHVVTPYSKKEEQERFQVSNLIIFQFPLYWFSLPSSLKLYIDNIYEQNIFYSSSFKKYGSSGLLSNVSYLFSVTLASKKEDLSSSFFQKQEDLDSLLAPFHYTNQYCGMKPLPTFEVYNSLQMDYSSLENRWFSYLEKIIHLLIS